jgi:hypothetical protein
VGFNDSLRRSPHTHACSKVIKTTQGIKGRLNNQPEQICIRTHTYTLERVIKEMCPLHHPVKGTRLAFSEPQVQHTLYTLAGQSGSRDQVWILKGIAWFLTDWVSQYTAAAGASWLLPAQGCQVLLVPQALVLPVAPGGWRLVLPLTREVQQKQYPPP